MNLTLIVAHGLRAHSDNELVKLWKAGRDFRTIHEGTLYSIKDSGALKCQGYTHVILERHHSRIAIALEGAFIPEMLRKREGWFDPRNIP